MAIPWSLPLSFQPPIPTVHNGRPGLGIVVADTSKSFSTVTVSPKFYALNPCEKRQFTATVFDKNGQEIKDAKISWESSNPKVATIDSKGVATAIKPGTAIIRPKYGKFKTEPASLFVRDKGVSREC